MSHSGAQDAARLRHRDGVTSVGYWASTMNFEIINIFTNNQKMNNVMEKQSVFATLNAINVNEHTEKKNGLTYLSWAWAWAEVKKCYPSAFYTVYENAQGMNYHTDGRTCWVKTGVTIDGLEHIEYLPVMDFRNASIPADKVTSFDVNKAIQRSLTKACARHGLGLYVYAGEDLPEAADGQGKNSNKVDDALTKAVEAINGASDLEELKQVYFKYEPQFKDSKQFMAAVTKRKEVLMQAA